MKKQLEKIEIPSSVVTEVELVYHNKSKLSERPLVKGSKDAYELLMQSWDDNKIDLQEQFRILLLDRKCKCIGVSTVATGGMSNCLVDLKIVFATALKASASQIILAHNHPSGDTHPSIADKGITAKFVQAGKVLELPVADHIIVSRDGYTSLGDDGFSFDI